MNPLNNWELVLPRWSKRLTQVMQYPLNQTEPAKHKRVSTWPCGFGPCSTPRIPVWIRPKAFHDERGGQHVAPGLRAGLQELRGQLGEAELGRPVQRRGLRSRFRWVAVGFINCLWPWKIRVGSTKRSKPEYLLIAIKLPVKHMLCFLLFKICFLNIIRSNTSK